MFDPKRPSYFMNGMARGTTDGPNITSLMRLRCLGAGWDINITKMLLKYIKPQTIAQFTRMYLAQLQDEYNDGNQCDDRIKMGESLFNTAMAQPDTYHEYITALIASDGIDIAAQTLALTEHYGNIYRIANANSGPINRLLLIPEPLGMCRLRFTSPMAITVLS